MSKCNKKNVNVGFLCQFFYPETVSSATLPFQTASYLSDHGYDVSCLCGYPKEYLNKTIKVPSSEVIDGINIFRIKYFSSSRKSFFGRLANYFSFTLKCLLNKRFFKECEYLVVYSNPPILPYVAYKIHKKYGTKIVFVSYDVYPEIALKTGTIRSKSIIARIMKVINKKVFSSAHKIVALSDDMKDFLTSSRNINSDKIEVIPNWFVSNEFKTPSNDSNVFCVTYLGNLGVCQDVDTILECANLMKSDTSIKFILGGHGKKMSNVISYISNHGLTNVETKPFLTGEEYSNTMYSSGCFLVSLEKNLNGLCFPSKYYSYLAYGRPIIAIADSGDLSKEVVSKKIGYHVKNGDYNSLVCSILKLKKLAGTDYLKMCTDARELFTKNYTADISLNKYLKLFTNK